MQGNHKENFLKPARLQGKYYHNPTQFSVAMGHGARDSARTCPVCLLDRYFIKKKLLLGQARVAYRYSGTDIRFEKNRYLPVSLRTGTKRHRFVFEYRFVLTD